LVEPRSGKQRYRLRFKEIWSVVINKLYLITKKKSKMKTFKISSALIICAMIVSSCKDGGVNPALDAEQQGISRTPMSGNYSEYIISPDEAMDMVAKDLYESGGEFAKKQIADIEPLLYSDFEFELQYFEELQELGIIEMSDPMMYIVRFVDGGYALMTTDRDFGVEIFHIQTGGEITKDEATAPSKAPTGGFNSAWAELVIANFKYKFGLMEEFILEWGDRWRLRHAPVDPFYRPTSWTEWANNWQNYQHNITNPAPSFFALNYYGTWGTLTSAVLEFLGYFENPSNFFGISGNWSAIKSWHGGINNHPAADWAWAIQDYCNVTDFSKVRNFLVNECSGQYPNARILQLTHDYDVKESGEISELLIGNKPVIAQYGNEIVLIYQEYLQKDLEYHYVVNINGQRNVYPTGRERYRSVIRYNAGYPMGGVSKATYRDYLPYALYYIAY